MMLLYLKSGHSNFIFAPNFLTRQIQDADFKCGICPNKVFLVPNLELFFVCEMLQLDNLRLVISNMTNVIQILAQKDLHEAFLVPNLGILIFSRNVAIRQIRRYCFKIRQFCFQIPAQKIPK